MKKEPKVTVIASGPDFDILLEERPFSTRGYPDKLLKIHHNGTAIVVAESDGNLVLVSQFRPIQNNRTIEFPGGVIEEGESAKDAAKREFFEETGLILNNMCHMGSFCPSIGTSDEKIHYYMGSCNIPKDKNLQNIDNFDRSDQSHTIGVLVMCPSVLEDLIRADKLEDGKTVLAYLLWKNLNEQRN